MPSNPGHYAWYPSQGVSKYYVWFKEMGHSNLDIHVYDDGSWDIIQYLNSPIIPSMTRWQPVLGPMKNIEISYAFCRYWVDKLDPRKKHYMREEDAKTQAVFDEAERTDRKAQELSSKATEAVMRNPGLVQRIAKNGLKEMDLLYLANRVPKHEIEKPLNGVRVDVPSTSQPTVENVHERVPGNPD